MYENASITVVANRSEDVLNVIFGARKSKSATLQGYISYHTKKLVTFQSTLFLDCGRECVGDVTNKEHVVIAGWMSTYISYSIMCGLVLEENPPRSSFRRLGYFEDLLRPPKNLSQERSRSFGAT